MDDSASTPGRPVRRPAGYFDSGPTNRLMGIEPPYKRGAILALQQTLYSGRKARQPPTMPRKHTHGVDLVSPPEPPSKRVCPTGEAVNQSVLPRVCAPPATVVPSPEAVLSHVRGDVPPNPVFVSAPILPLSVDNRPPAPPVSEPSTKLPDEPVKPGRKTTLRMLSSPMYNHNGGCFEPVFDEKHNLSECRCLVGGCDSVYVVKVSSGKRGGLTAARNHYLDHCKSGAWKSQPAATLTAVPSDPVMEREDPSAELGIKSLLTAMKSEPAQPDAISPFKHWRNSRALAVDMLMSTLPLCRPDHAGFHELCRVIATWTPPSRNTVLADHIEALDREFGEGFVVGWVERNSFSVLFDCWKTGKAGGSSFYRYFVGVALFTVDENWVPRTCLLDLKELRCAAKDAKSLVPYVRNSLVRVKIPRESWINFVTDNHNTEVSVANTLVEEVGEEDSHQASCSVHTVDLGVKDVVYGRKSLAPIPIVKQIVDVVHEVVGLFVNSGNAAEVLRKAYEDTKSEEDPPRICFGMDSKVKWNSVYYMCRKVSSVRKTVATALERLKENSLWGRFVEIENDLPYLVKLLSFVEQASMSLQSDLCSLSILIPVMYQLEADISSDIEASAKKEFGLAIGMSDVLKSQWPKIVEQLKNGFGGATRSRKMSVELLLRDQKVVAATLLDPRTASFYWMPYPKAAIEPAKQLIRKLVHQRAIGTTIILFYSYFYNSDVVCFTDSGRLATLGLSPPRPKHGDQADAALSTLAPEPLQSTFHHPSMSYLSRIKRKASPTSGTDFEAADVDVTPSVDAATLLSLNDVTRYFSADHGLELSPDPMVPFNWWRSVGRKQFPYVEPVARRFASMVGGNAQVERYFSTARRWSRDEHCNIGSDHLATCVRVGSVLGRPGFTLDSVYATNPYLPSDADVEECLQ